MQRIKPSWVFALTCAFLFAGATFGIAQQAPQAPLSASQIDQLVAPIALYPDALVAQVLAASTYPNQVVDANNWLQANSSLTEAQRTEQVNNQSWDASVKALTQFPSVLANMANNLTWTSALGEAFYNQQADVMAAVQTLRKQAQTAGNLKSSSQQTVTTQTQNGQQVIVIQPANPQVVYVPSYNPTVVYGTPYTPPGYSAGATAAAGALSFGAGVAVGAAMSGGCCGWGGGNVVFNNNVYISHTNIYHHPLYQHPTPPPNHGGKNNNNHNDNNSNHDHPTPPPTSGKNADDNRNNDLDDRNRQNAANRNNAMNNRERNPNANREYRPNENRRPNQMANRGYGERRPDTRSTAFSGYGPGGRARTESERGRQSFGGARRAPHPAPHPVPHGGGGGRRR